MNCIRAIDRITDPRAFAAFERSDTPVVLESQLGSWRALARWSPAYLSDLVGDVAIRCKRSDTGAHPNFGAGSRAAMFATEACSVRELVAAVTTDRTGCRLFTGDEKFLLRRRNGVTTIDPDLAPLLDDVELPALLPPERLYTVWPWLSGAGVRTWLHYDNNGCHNFNAQITGEKDCLLIAPDQLDQLALFPPGGDNPAVNCSEIDIHAPDFARYPQLDDVPVLTARLGPGDLLFIPAWWLHAFRHVGAFNSNVNFWWRPEAARDNPVSRRQAAIDAASAAPAHGS